MKHGLEHLRLDLGPDLRVPDILAADVAEHREPEQRQGDERDERLERDRARVRQEVVLAEEVDPQLDELLRFLALGLAAGHGIPSCPPTSFAKPIAARPPAGGRGSQARESPRR